MKQTRKLLTLLTMLMLVTSAYAENVQNYLCDFNREIKISGTKTYNGNSETSTHSNNAASAFKPGPGWGKTIITRYSSGYYSYYEAWAWRADGGVGNSAYLSGRTSSHDIKDYLITPVVSGNVSLYAKLYGSGETEYVKVYACTEESNGTFTIGDEIEMTNAGDVTASAWTQISTTVATPSRLAIRVRNAGIDNFAADEAEVEYEKSMKLTVTNKSTNSPDCNAEGFFQVSCDVTVTNTGEIALTPDTEGYEVFIQEATTSALVGTDKWGVTPITEPLAIGETSQVYHLVANIPYIGHEGNKRYDAAEGISLSHEMATTAWVTPIAYEPLFTFSPEKENTVLDNGLNISFGKISEDKSVTYRIRNRGAAPLRVNSIAMPAGFTASVTGEFDVPAHGEQNVVITASAATPGIFSGAMTITYSDTETFTVNLTSVVLDTNKFYWTFDNQKWPSGTLVGDSWKVESDGNHGYSNYYASHSNSTNPTFFFTPLMHAEAGEQLAFDVAKKGSNSFLNVYVTTDRNNPGTAVKEIAAAQMSNNKVGGSYSSAYEFSTFTITIPEAGDYYIGFEGGYVLVNDLYGLTPVAVEHDVMLNDVKLPATATVNNASEASVKVLNTLATAETGYTLAYHLGTQTYTAEAVDLTQNDVKTITVAFTPHEAGDFDSWIDITLSNGDVISTAHQTVTVAAEVASAEEQIGEGKATTTYVPLTSSYGNTDTEMIYKASQLGLAANTTINNITFKGYKTSIDKNGTLKLYIANTTDEAPTFTNTASMETAVAGMTELYNATYTIKKGGSSTNYQPLISVDIPEGFTYTGNNLRIYLSWYSIKGPGESSNYSNNTHTWKADNISGQVKTRTKDSDLSSMTFSASSYLPTLFLGVEKDPSTLSGKVTVLCADNTVSNVTGAKVTAAAGDVEYYATTDAEGNYSMVIMQDKLTYTLSVDYSEKNLFPQEDVVEMNGTSQTYDIQYEEGVDFLVNDVNIPVTGTINNAYTATITLTNYNQTALAAADYNVQLVIDDEVVAEGSVDAAPMEAVTIPLSFVPHAAGTVNAHIFVDAPTRDKTTADVAVAIAEESAGGDVVVGTQTATGSNSSKVPFHWYDKHGMTDMVYDAAYLKKYGLEKGATVTSISFKQWYSSNKDEGKTTLKAWVGLTNESGNNFVPGNINKADMVEVTLIESDSYTFPSSTEEAPVVYTINLSATPLVLDGTNGIRIYTEMENGAYLNTSTATDGNYIAAYSKGSDSSTLEQVAGMSWGSAIAVPLMYVTTNNAKHYTGVVKYADETPAAGATITLTSGDVIYSGVAEADGTFDITVVQHSLDFNVVATDGEYTANAVVNLDIDDSPAVLVLTTATGINSISNDARTADRYNVAGQRVNDSHKGIIISRGKKYVNK